jgi:hypothetical protein
MTPTTPTIPTTMTDCRRVGHPHEDHEDHKDDKHDKGDLQIAVNELRFEVEESKKIANQLFKDYLLLKRLVEEQDAIEQVSLQQTTKIIL